MKLFKADGPFQVYGTLVFDLIFLNFLWLCLTIIGLGLPFGVANTALYYSLDKSIINGRGYVLKTFWKSVKTNVKQATLVWLLMAVAYGILIINIIFLNNFVEMGVFGTVLLIANYFIFFELILISVYIFPLLSKLNMSTKNLLINSFILAHKHILTSLICVILTALPFAAIIFVSPACILFAFSVSAYFVSKLIVGRVLKKYYSEDQLTSYELD